MNPTHNDGDRPTAKQLTYLRALATRAGQTFTPPRTRRQASREIRRLKTIQTTGFTFAELEGEQAPRQANDDVAVHPFEVSGYGASATWSQRS